MATMATTSHGLSVYVNSCVKNPLNSRTRHSAIFSEHTPEPTRLISTDPGPFRNSGNDVWEDEQADVAVGSSFEAADELKTLKDDQFYIKLQHLKENNRKTLEECERLYREKYGGGDKALGEQAAKEMVERMFAARLAERSGHVDHTETAVRMNGDIDAFSQDRAAYVSAKPPPVPTTSASKRNESILSKTMPSREPSYYVRSDIVRPHPSSAPAVSQQIRRSYSLDEQDWRRAVRASYDRDDEEVQSERAFDPELETAMTRIRDMWEGFKINDNTAEERRRSSSLLASKTRNEKNDELVDNWRHRITIPKPFQMTLRESTKVKKQTKAQEELEIKRLEKERQDLEECQKKFKAQPAPAHIYLPLYDEIQEKNEARRRYVKQHCEEMLKLQEKPFNLTKRQEEKKQQRIRSATVAEKIARSAQKAKIKEQRFSARPVPEFVKSTEPSERLLEEEEYRKIRIKMRAKELLRESALPPNMELNQKMKEQREKEKLMKAKQKQNKRRPKSSHEVPDYDQLYHQFQKEMTRRKKVKEPTMVDPFSLHTNNLRSSRERVLKDMERDEKLMRETARATPRLHLGVLSSSLDSIPCKSTASADLRTGYFRSAQERELRKEEQRQEEERRRRMREGKLRKYILERSEQTPRLEDSLKGRLKKHKEADSARLEQYEKDLEEMKERVQKRPLLFEREIQSSAGKAAERKFKTTLKSAGIDEELLQTRSSAAPSAQEDDELYEDDYEQEN